MHPLIKLNRAYAAGEISLGEVLADVRANSPDLFIDLDKASPELRELYSRIEIPPAQPLTTEQTSDPVLVDFGFDDPPLTPTEQAHSQAQDTIQKTQWMSQQTNKAVKPYDDFGSVPPLNG